MLTNCYLNSLKLALKYKQDNNLDNVSIAFPCISTGVYHYPKDEACMIAIDTVNKFNDSSIDVIFVCFEENDYELYKGNLNV